MAGMKLVAVILMIIGTASAGILIGMYLNAAPGSEVQPALGNIVFAATMLFINAVGLILTAGHS